MLRYAIVDGAVTSEALDRLRAQAVDYVQLRDKSLPSGALAVLAERILRAMEGSATQLLLNSRADVAIAVGAAGVHLPSSREALTVAQVRTLYRHAGLGNPVVSVAAHSLDEARQGRGADLILFAPIFEKRIYGQLTLPGVGLEALAEACWVFAPTPVLALGGVTAENAATCTKAGAAGIAGIRLFLDQSPAR